MFDLAFSKCLVDERSGVVIPALYAEGPLTIAVDHGCPDWVVSGVVLEIL